MNAQDDNERDVILSGSEGSSSTGVEILRCAQDDSNNNRMTATI